MFAGPNGSGKSTLKAYLPTDLLGVYLNPDEIELGIRNRGFLDVAQHGVVVTGAEVLQFSGIPTLWRRLDLRRQLMR